MHLEDAFGIIQTILKYAMEYTEWWGFSDLILEAGLDLATSNADSRLRVLHIVTT